MRNRFFFVGYCNNELDNQVSFTVFVDGCSVGCLYPKTTFTNGLPSGPVLTSIDGDTSISGRNHQYLSMRFEGADFELKLDLVSFEESMFYTGLHAYDSGSSGKLNSECVRAFVESNAELLKQLRSV